jgi:fumarate hydratase, class II
MVIAQVNGNDEIVASSVQSGQFELNTMMPLIAHTLLLSIKILSNATKIFTTHCLHGLDADREHCAETLERNLSLVTGLAPLIGYDKAAEIAKEAWASNRTIREIAEAWNVLSGKELDKALDPDRMTRPGYPDQS